MMAGPDRICSRCGARYDSSVIFCPSDGTPLGEKRLPIGEDPYLGLTLPGGVRLDELVGIGAVGRVYRGHDGAAGSHVAVKILHRDLLGAPSVVARFEREQRIASRLVHPNVVRMLETGRLPEAGPARGGEAFLVMEHLDGISLRSALAASCGAFPMARTLHVMLQIADAVGEAHDQGIVHRDLKPENVMLVRQGEDADFVKVLDFGVARVERADTSMATQAGSIFGTARYVSPEAAKGATATAESDVYSLGVMLFECLAGETPFDGDSAVSILIQHTSQPPPDVRSVARASYVPEPLALTILECLSKAPGARPKNGRAFGLALRAAARRSGLSPAGTGSVRLASIERTKQAGTPEPSGRGEG
jgi:serine/threonine-protein kinase